MCGYNSQSRAKGMNAGSKQPEATNVWELLRNQNTNDQEFKAAYALKKHTLKKYQDTHTFSEVTFTITRPFCGYYYAALATGVQIVFSGLLTELHTARPLCIVMHCETVYCRLQKCFS